MSAKLAARQVLEDLTQAKTAWSPPTANDNDELVVDLFAGGCGASTAIRMVLGRGPHIGINHDEEAIALHAATHPETRPKLSRYFTVIQWAYI